MTTGTTPKPRVIRFENPDMSGKSYLTLSVAALQWNRLRDVLRWRAIVAVPRKCRGCDGRGRTVCAGGTICTCHTSTGHRCTDCDGAGHQRCSTCRGIGKVCKCKTPADLCTACATDLKYAVWDNPCPDCINGVLHDEHEVGVSEAIGAAIFALDRDSDRAYRAVLAALTGEGSET